METVYIILTISVAAVAVVTVVVLRNRITKARVDVSLNERKASAEFGATQPNRTASEDTPPQTTARRIPRTGFVGNIAQWWSRIRAPEGARVVNNVASLRSTIEVIPREQPKAETDQSSPTKKHKR